MDIPRRDGRLSSDDGGDSRKHWRGSWRPIQPVGSSTGTISRWDIQPLPTIEQMRFLQARQGELEARVTEARSESAGRLDTIRGKEQEIAALKARIAELEGSVRSADEAVTHAYAQSLERENARLRMELRWRDIFGDDYTVEDPREDWEGFQSGGLGAN